MSNSQKSNQKSAGQIAVKESDRLPLRHVAIIMDGNRRWADRRGLPRLLGHREGVQALKRLVKHVTALKLEYLTVYAFSSENWQRGKEEVDYLMDLFNDVLKTELVELAKGGARLRFIGDLAGMPESLQKGLKEAEEKTKCNTSLNLQVALNYGSRTELTEAVKQIVAAAQSGKLSQQDITADLIASYLYTAGLPDPDLMIRTGGEMRLSNYLLWQSAYTELFVTPTMWPEFMPADFDQAVTSYELRQRRYGGD